jgi:hypothetical protein
MVMFFSEDLKPLLQTENVWSIAGTFSVYISMETVVHDFYIMEHRPFMVVYCLLKTKRQREYTHTISLQQKP